MYVCINYTYLQYIFAIPDNILGYWNSLIYFLLA